jgi:hypothetical protein
MPTMIRTYRDGPAYLAAADRIQTTLLPCLERIDGFQHLSMLRFCSPSSTASAGLCLVAFDRADQLTEAVRQGTAWSQRHLRDLTPVIQPSDLFPAQLLFARGPLV